MKKLLLFFALLFINHEFKINSSERKLEHLKKTFNENENKLSDLKKQFIHEYNKFNDIDTENSIDLLNRLFNRFRLCYKNRDVSCSIFKHSKTFTFDEEDLDAFGSSMISVDSVKLFLKYLNLYIDQLALERKIKQKNLDRYGINFYTTGLSQLRELLDKMNAVYEERKKEHEEEIKIKSNAGNVVNEASYEDFIRKNALSTH